MSDLNPANSYATRKRADSASDSANGSSVTGDTTSDRDYDIINSYNFVLRVEGFQNLPLKSVRGINKQNEYEYIQEGGLNDYVHMVRKPISQPFTFQVERYVSQDWLQDAIDPLANGTELILPLVLYMYRSNAHDGTGPSRFYIFTNCRVTGVQIGDLDAEKSGLHTITNTIAYAQMTIVTVPFVGIDDDGMYRFNSDGAENLKNTSHVRTLHDMGITKVGKLDKSYMNEGETSEAFEQRNAKLNYRGNRSKTDMKTLSNKYKFNVDEKGNTTNLESTVVQEQDEAEIRKYQFSDDGVHPNNENTDSVAEPEIYSFSKDIMEMHAAENKYVFATDKNKNKEHTNRSNVEGPKAKSKSDMANEAKAKKYQFKRGSKANTDNVNAVKPNDPQLSKEDMIGKAKKYNFKSKRNKSAVQDEFEINKMAMKAKADMYNKEPHYAEQENVPSEEMAAKAKKYPATRSARDVSEFLGRKK